MSERVNGSGGIPLKGREKEYATELWLDDPKAFWLHPEGPLSDTTPDEWVARREAEEDRAREARMAQALANPYANSLTSQFHAQTAMQAMQAQMQYNLAQNQLQQHQQRMGLFGQLLPF